MSLSVHRTAGASALAGLLALSPISAAQAQGTSIPSYLLFGEIGVGTKTAFGDVEGIADSSYVVPTVLANGKVVFRPSGTPFGIQLGGQVQGFDLRWIDPDPQVDGHYRALSGAVHLTYTANERVKFGAFAGLNGIEFHVGDSMDWFTFENKSRLFGLEAMVMPDPRVLLFGRIAYVDPRSGSFELGLGGVVDTFVPFTDSDNQLDGFHFGGGYRHALGRNFILGADVDYTSLDFGGEARVGVLDLEGSLAYNLPNHPAVSIIGTLGYSNLTISTPSSGSGSEHAFNAGLKAVVHLGPRPSGVDGMFFNIPVD